MLQLSSMESLLERKEYSGAVPGGRGGGGAPVGQEPRPFWASPKL